MTREANDSVSAMRVRIWISAGSKRTRPTTALWVGRVLLDPPRNHKSAETVLSCRRTISFSDHARHAASSRNPLIARKLAE